MKNLSGAGWRVFQDLEARQAHVLPINDLRDHAAKPDCWCKPKQDEEFPTVHVHNALDGRELVERGERRVQ